jgi:hypothetical protein
MIVFRHPSECACGARKYFRSGIALPPISTDKLAEYLSSGGATDRINSLIKSGELNDPLGDVPKPQTQAAPEEPQRASQEQAAVTPSPVPRSYLVFFGAIQV